MGIGDTLAPELVLHHDVGRGQRRFGCLVIAVYAVQSDVAGRLIPDQGSLGRKSLLDVRHGRPDLIIDAHQLGRVVRRRGCLSNDDGDGLADVADPLQRQREL